MNDNSEIDRKETFGRLLDDVKGIVDSEGSRDRKLLTVCELLSGNIPYYDWVGFYLVKGKCELRLGPFAGESTEHDRIAFGNGICGQVAEKKETILVPDVSVEKNYLSCCSKVKSEIVVPIFRDDALVGELDIDSHTISAFTEDDREFLEKVCAFLSRLF